MKTILITLLGSIGDIQPLINLSLFLKKKNIKCLFLVPSNYKKFVESYNFKCFVYNYSKNKFSKTKKQNTKLKKKNTFKKNINKNVNKINNDISIVLKKSSECNHIFDINCMIKMYYNNIHIMLNNIYLSTINIINNILETTNIDLVIGMNNNILLSSICEALNLNLIHIMHFPWIHNTKQFSHPFLCCKDSLSYPYNLFNNNYTWNYILKIIWITNKKLINKARNNLNLNNINSFDNYKKHLYNIPQIYTMSKYFLGNVKEWSNNNNILLSGFLLTNSKNKQIPSILKEKIKENKKIIYIGFGSLYINKKTYLSIINTIKLNNNMYFILQGQILEFYNNDKLILNNVIKIDRFPHDILFKYVDLVIGSGGIGTLINSLRNFKPVIVVPINADQYFNGNIIKNRKLGTYILKNNLDTLDIELRTILNSKIIKKNVIKFGNNINEENSYINIYKFIKPYLNYNLN